MSRPGYNRRTLEIKHKTRTNLSRQYVMIKHALILPSRVADLEGQWQASWRTPTVLCTTPPSDSESSYYFQAVIVVLILITTTTTFRITTHPDSTNTLDFRLSGKSEPGFGLGPSIMCPTWGLGRDHARGAVLAVAAQQPRPSPPTRRQERRHCR